MTLSPYSIPHDCEKAELAARLLRLKTNQRKVLRSYVRNVLAIDGTMTLTQWVKSDTVPRVSMSVWRKPADKDGNYWGTEDSPNVAFREAVDAYLIALNRWETDEEEKSVRSANRQIRLGALKAANELVNLVEYEEDARIRLDASKTVLDRASVDTAAKGSINIDVSELTNDELKAIIEAES